MDQEDVTATLNENWIYEDSCIYCTDVFVLPLPGTIHTTVDKEHLHAFNLLEVNFHLYRAVEYCSQRQGKTRILIESYNL